MIVGKGKEEPLDALRTCGYCEHVLVCEGAQDMKRLVESRILTFMDEDRLNEPRSKLILFRALASVCGHFSSEIAS